jgi:hypothetical protein
MSITWVLNNKTDTMTIQNVTSGELLIKQAMKKKIIYKKFVQK